MNTYLTAIIAVTIIGILNTIYLTYCCITKTDVKCLFLPEKMCTKVQYSSYSKTFGIPNPYLGLAMLMVILGLTLLFIKSAVPFWLIYSVITVGFLFSLYFTYIQAFRIRAFCTWCVLSAFVFVVLFVLASVVMLSN